MHEKINLEKDSELGKLLLEQGIITEDILNKAREIQAESEKNGNRIPIGNILYDKLGIKIADIERVFIREILILGVKKAVMHILDEDRLMNNMKSINQELKAKTIRENIKISIPHYSRKITKNIKVLNDGDEIHEDEEEELSNVISGALKVIFDSDTNKVELNTLFTFELGKNSLILSKQEIVGILRPSIVNHIQKIIKSNHA